eukprot:6213434-Pleurochrysis_carterae.AAC.3
MDMQQERPRERGVGGEATSYKGRGEHVTGTGKGVERRRGRNGRERTGRGRAEGERRSEGRRAE